MVRPTVAYTTLVCCPLTVYHSIAVGRIPIKLEWDWVHTTCGNDCYARSTFRLVVGVKAQWDEFSVFSMASCLFGTGILYRSRHISAIDGLWFDVATSARTWAGGGVWNEWVANPLASPRLRATSNRHDDSAISLQDDRWHWAEISSNSMSTLDGCACMDPA